ncbi:MAG TPA: ABC transporter permease, partial [Microbacterium sp.]|nr:ABC transporter permease [Microbacterium sp.]
MTATLIPTATPAAVSTTAAAIARGRRIRRRRWTVITAILAVIVLAVVAISTMVGHTFYTPVDVVRVILGETVPGASFTVGELRLPRALLAL